MSQENVAVVLRNFETFEHDEEAWLATADPALEWYPIEEGHSLSRGHEAAVRVRRSWLENWEGHQMDVEEMKDGGDSVVACLHLTGRGKMSGVEVDLRVYMHFKLTTARSSTSTSMRTGARPSKPPDCGNRALAERAQRQAGGFALRSWFAR